MATYYMGHRITVFTKIAVVYFGNLTKNIYISQIKLKNFNGTASGTVRIETTLF